MKLVRTQNKMKKIKLIIAALIFVVCASGFLSATPSASAAVDISDAKDVSCKGTGGTPAAPGGKCTGGGTLTSIFQTVANILLFVVGAAAVIMLIIGGFRYVTSNGDSTAITGAKNTVMYAIIGIVVAFLAFAAVNFVTNQLAQSSTAAHRDDLATSTCASATDSSRAVGAACRRGFSVGYDGGSKANTCTGDTKSACEAGFDVGKEAKAREH